MSNRIHYSFELTMPQNSSWNGKWSGEGRRYVRVLTLTDSRKTREKYAKLTGDHRYSFGDGWVANIRVDQVTGEQKRRLVKQSAGFCGYDWMIESLRLRGKITVDET